ncbi:MAG: hypothetical protein ACOH2N_19330 [Devosia sp.]
MENIYQNPIKYYAMHRRVKSDLERYIQSGWCRNRFDESLRLEMLYWLSEDGMQRQSAVHPEVRINLLGDLLTEISRVTVSNERVYSVTLCPLEFACPTHKARSYDLAPLTQWIQAELLGLNFVGIVDAGLYPDLKAVSYALGLVSWHVHGMVWGVSAAEMKAIKADINERHSPLFEGPKAAHSARLVEAHNVVEWARYMAKPSTFKYRTEDHKRARRLDQKWQRPERASGGELLKICSAQAGLAMADLLVATGKGRSLIGRVLRAGRP